MDYLYGLLDSEEIYRIPTNIKHRLANLTLSKKKELRKSLQSNLSQEHKSPKLKEISRNILLELLTDDSSEGEADEINKIFIGTSLPQEKTNLSGEKKLEPARLYPQLDNFYEADYDETFCTEAEILKAKNIKKQTQNVPKVDIVNLTDNMEKLQFSHNENINEDFAIDNLSQKISILDIYSPVKSLKQIENTPEKTQVVSVESERKSSGRTDSNEHFIPLKIKYDSLNVQHSLEKTVSNLDSLEEQTEINKSLSNSILSISSKSVESNNKSYETTVCSEDDEEDEIIIVSDSDTSENSDQPPKKPLETSENFSDRVSELRPSGQTFLPNTMSNDKADRLEAFLNDLPIVGQENNSFYENPVIDTSIVKSTDESIPNSSGPQESIEIPGTLSENELKDQCSEIDINNSIEDKNEKTNSNNSALGISIPVDNDSSVIKNKFSEKSYVSNDIKNDISSNSSEYEYEQINIAAKFNFKIQINSPKTNIVVNQESSPESSENNNNGSNETPNTQESKQSEIYQEKQKAVIPEPVNDILNDTSNKKLCVDIPEPVNDIVNDTSNKKPSIIKPKKINTSNKKKDNIIPLVDKNEKKLVKTNLNSKFDETPKNDTSNKKLSVENVDEKAKEILTKLYGHQWQTPENIKKLDKTNSKSQLAFDNCLKQNLHNENNNSSIINPKKINIGDTKKDNIISLLDKNEKDLIKTNLNSKFDESAITDFSIFHKNIRNDLESTRLNTNIVPEKVNKPIRPIKAPTSEKQIKKTKLPVLKKIPQTEKSNIIKSSTRSGRHIKRRSNWKDLLEDDNFSEYECTDDSDVDATFNDLQFSSSDSISDGSYTKKSHKIKTKKKGDSSKKILNKNEDDIIYLDLSCDVVKVLDKSKSPPPKHSPTSNDKRQNILQTYTFEPRKQLPSTGTPSRRKLFTPKFGDEDEILPPDSPLRKLIDDLDEIKLSIPLPSIFGMPINKNLESVRTGKPIFKLPTSIKKPVYDSPKSRTDKENYPKLDANFQTPKTHKTPKTPKNQDFNLYDKNIPEYSPVNKYGFLKSLDVMVPKSRCDPDALVYRNSYKTKKEELTQRLYNLYNEKIFKNELKVEVIWNKKLNNTAGRCSNKKKGNIRSSVIELSEKVLTSPDRLRCTLIHELCHAATWIFNGEHGHGAVWKTWANKANLIFQELPKIGVCHTYDIEYKYTYKCKVCLAKSHAHSKSKKVENIRCAYCHGAIEILLNKKDKEGNIVSTPIKEATGFAKFVQENYKNFKSPKLTHGDVMKLLSSKYALSKDIDK